ncbi:MAG: hypothetical protein ACQESB_07600 [Elusimicrobiota bacterium]
MRCKSCKAYNKENRDVCKRCGKPLDAGLWQPSWGWSLKVLGIIYAVLLVFYVGLRVVL